VEVVGGLMCCGVACEWGLSFQDGRINQSINQLMLEELTMMIRTSAVIHLYVLAFDIVSSS